MTKKKDFSETISIRQLRLELAEVIQSEHRGLIIESITAGLEENEGGLFSLWLALRGKERPNIFGIGTECLVQKNYLYYWDINEVASQNAKLMRGDKVKCIITDFNPYSSKGYRISYKIIDRGSTEKIFDTWVHPSALEPVEESPGAVSIVVEI